MAFWDFGGARIAVLSKVPFIWIAHAWSKIEKIHFLEKKVFFSKCSHF
jgi:hypothetical protein